MRVYRIIFARYAEPTFAPGISGRWNREGERVLYTSSSPALAMSETLAHRLGQGFLTAGYHLLTLEVPDELTYDKVPRSALPEDWRLFSSYADSQKLGSAWYQRGKTLMLRVPSAVVPVDFATGDYNVVFNATHPAYGQLHLARREPFPFDPRFVEADRLLQSPRPSSKGKSSDQN